MRYAELYNCSGCVPLVTGELVKMLDLISFDEKLFVAEMKQKHIYVVDRSDVAQFITGTGSMAHKVMVMGAYDEMGAGPLQMCDQGEKINASTFAQYLRTRLMSFLNARNKCCGIFDNAGPHKGVALPVFTELGIKTTDHPANSPDLNPIELCWARMADMVSANLPWGENFSLARFKLEIDRAWITCAGPGTFTKDMQHVAKILDKVQTHNGGNKFA